MDLQKVLHEVGEVLQAPGAGQEDLANCETALERVLEQERENVGVWFMIATTYMRQRRWSLAERWLSMVIKSEPHMVEALNNYAFTLEHLGEHEIARRFFKRAHKLRPDDPALINNLATGYINNGTPEKALAAADKAIALQPDFNDAHWNRGLALLEMGQWREGWDEHAWGLKLDAVSSQQRKVRHYIEKDQHPWWDGTPNQRVVVYSEQGVGDEILAASMLSDASRDVDIIFESQPRLVNIMRHSFPGIPVYGTRKHKWKDLKFPNWSKIDAKCAIFELGKVYRNEDSAFPREAYLKAFPELVAEFDARLKDVERPRIGIAWQGGSPTTRIDLRTIPLMQWLPILRNVDAEFISLQYDHAGHPGFWQTVVDDFNKDMSVNVRHWGDDVNDLDMCYGGLIHSLDLVISVNTSLVHACGAFGVNCWTLTPSKPAWRYGVKGEHMAWYGDWVRQIRQKGSDWGPVMQRVERELQEWVEDADNRRVRAA